MRFIKLIFIWLSVLPIASLYGQWTKSLAVTTIYDDNAFRNYAELSDYATQFSAYLAKDYAGENWQSRFFYRGNFNLFAEYNERNYHAHQLGAAWSRIWGRQGNALNLGANGSLRANGTNYDYYNFKEASGYGNFKISLGSGSANFGYKIRGRWYSNLSELSYTEHYLFARYSHFFETRTTFMIEGNYGLKTYREQTVETDIPQSNDGHYGEHRGGMGHFGQGSSTMGNGATSMQAKVSQWVGTLRLAQSLTNTTGLSTEFTLRKNPSVGVRYLAGQVSGYTTEDELFDDRYGYESEEFGATLTQLLPWHTTLKTGLQGQWKDYVNRPALDLNGEVLPSGELRRDRQFIAWLSLGKSFYVRGSKSIDLFGEFYWIDNQSNDLYYHYKVSSVSLGISTAF